MYLLHLLPFQMKTLKLIEALDGGARTMHIIK